MFCQKCGKEADNDAIICVNCGCALQPEKLDKLVKNQNAENQEQINQDKEKSKIKENHEIDFNSSKITMGIVFGLFFGILGLIAGLQLYPINTKARMSFLISWAITTIIVWTIAIIICIVFAILGIEIPLYLMNR